MQVGLLCLCLGVCWCFAARAVSRAQEAFRWDWRRKFLREEKIFVCWWADVLTLGPPAGRRKNEKESGNVAPLAKTFGRLASHSGLSNTLFSRRLFCVEGHASRAKGWELARNRTLNRSATSLNYSIIILLFTIGFANPRTFKSQNAKLYNLHQRVSFSSPSIGICLCFI